MEELLQEERDRQASALRSQPGRTAAPRRPCATPPLPMHSRPRISATPLPAATPGRGGGGARRSELSSTAGGCFPCVHYSLALLGSAFGVARPFLSRHCYSCTLLRLAFCRRTRTNTQARACQTCLAAASLTPCLTKRYQSCTRSPTARRSAADMTMQPHRLALRRLFRHLFRHTHTRARARTHTYPPMLHQEWQKCVVALRPDPVWSVPCQAVDTFRDLFNEAVDAIGARGLENAATRKTEREMSFSDCKSSRSCTSLSAA